MGFKGKHSDLARELMKTGTWDKVLELTPETSTYYALSVEKYGKAMADYYWERRRNSDKERDIINWQKECKEITRKCEEFLKSRGVDIWKGY